MKSHTAFGKTACKTTDDWSQHSSASESAVAIVPPDYGIDSIDRDLKAQAGPVLRASGAGNRVAFGTGEHTLTSSVRPVPINSRAPVTPAGDNPRTGVQAGNHTGSFDFGERGLRATRLEEKEAIRGVGDTISDVVDVIGTGLGNVVGATAGLLTGISISSTTNAGPTFGPQGATMWHVAFTTTGRTGWIVQKIHNTLNGTDSAGTAMTPASIGLTPDYYEAWSVDAAGNVTPSVGGDNDHWDQGGMGAGSKGHWSTTASLWWMPGAATPAGMAAGTVPSAGILVSSLAAPPSLGVARLHRYAHASWDDTVAPAVDTGSAGPL